MGIRLQLGHPEGVRCPFPKKAFDDDFVVIHADGVESVALDFCGCPSGASHVVQLLRHRLFPATTTDPRTAATFHVLDTFQMLSFTGRISAFEYMRALTRKTNNCGTEDVPVSHLFVAAGLSSY